MKLALVLGTSAAALEEFQRACDFARAKGALELCVIAVNDAIRLFPIKPHAFCTVISSQIAVTRFLDGVDTSGVKLYARRPSSDIDINVVKPKWNGHTIEPSGATAASLKYVPERGPG